MIRITELLVKSSLATFPCLSTRVFGAYSLDVIAGTAFGMETDFLTNQNDAILQAALNISGKQTHLDILQGFLSE